MVEIGNDDATVMPLFSIVKKYFAIFTEKKIYHKSVPTNKNFKLNLCLICSVVRGYVFYLCYFKNFFIFHMSWQSIAKRQSKNSK